LKAEVVVELRRENTVLSISLKNTDKANYVMCFVNYQLRRLEATVIHVHAHVVIHSIC